MPKADLSAYTGREQAYVKHYLLEKYLAPLAYKVGSAWDSFVYVDGFSGPWKTTRPDYADSSFAVAIDVLREVRTGLQEQRGRDLPIHIILVEQDKNAFAALEKFRWLHCSSHLRRIHRNYSRNRSAHPKTHYESI